MIHEIWIEVESGSEPWDREDCNSDVVVTLDSGLKWMASFFTYKNILSLSEKNEKTGENLKGLYICSTDMILIKTLDRESIEKTIADLIRANDFEVYFSKVS